MHRLWPIILLAAAGSSLAADVYRTYDEQGNPVFSDQPTEGAEKIELEDITTVPGLENIPPPIEQPAQPAPIYRQLSLIRPEHEKTYFRGEGPLPVDILVEPRLRRGHTVVVLLDGLVVQTGTATSYALPEIDRGAHELSVIIRGPRGDVLKSTETVTFYMRQASRLHPPANLGPGG